MNISLRVEHLPEYNPDIFVHQPKQNEHLITLTHKDAGVKCYYADRVKSKPRYLLFSGEAYSIMNLLEKNSRSAGIPRRVMSTFFQSPQEGPFFIEQTDLNLPEKYLRKKRRFIFHPTFNNRRQIDYYLNANPFYAAGLRKCEKEYFLKFNAARFLNYQLWRSFLDGETKNLAKESSILEQIISDTESIIAEKNLPAISDLIRTSHTRSPFFDLEELSSAGHLAMLRAIRTFNVRKGLKFSTFLYNSVLREFGRVVVKEAKQRRLIPLRFGYEPQNVFSADSQKQLEDEEEVKILTAKIRSIELTEREKKVLGYRFGLDEMPFLTFEKLGVRLNICKESVHQIQLKAIEKIKSALAEEIAVFTSYGN